MIYLIFYSLSIVRLMLIGFLKAEDDVLPINETDRAPLDNRTHSNVNLTYFITYKL